MLSEKGFGQKLNSCCKVSGTKTYIWRALLCWESGSVSLTSSYRLLQVRLSDLGGPRTPTLCHMGCTMYQWFYLLLTLHGIGSWLLTFFCSDSFSPSQTQQSSNMRRKKIKIAAIADLTAQLCLPGIPPPRGHSWQNNACARYLPLCCPSVSMMLLSQISFVFCREFPQ